MKFTFYFAICFSFNFVNEISVRSLKSAVMKRSFIIGLMLASISFALMGRGSHYHDVDPLVGTYNLPELSNGNLYPCIARPWGMNHWTPQTDVNGDRWQYSYSDNRIVGFKQTHQPSPWAGDYGMFSVMPTTGEVRYGENERASWFSHKTERIHPAYYGVYLPDYDIEAEISPTSRGCVMRFRYPRSSASNIIVDAFGAGSFIQVDLERNRVQGSTDAWYGFGDRFPEGFRNWFVIECDKKIRNFDMKDGVVALSFDTEEGEEVTLRMASSFIDLEQAELNLRNEIGERTFDDVASEGRKEWERHLDRFDVVDASVENHDDVRMFYTALYRLLLYPREFFEYDADGNIRHRSPFNGEICDGRMYTDNGYWDTFRSVHPFLNLFYPEQSRHILEGLANTWHESGWLPEWASPGHVDCMIGQNSASVAASAIILNDVKDERILDAVWDGLVKGAHNEHPAKKSVGRHGAEAYDRLGYVPNDIGVTESAARTLEYAYADYCIKCLAEYMGKDADTVSEYASRAMNYRNLFNPDHGLMSGRDSKGNFRKDFNPLTWGGDFTEGNSYHYTWSVFHDPHGLMQLMGGRDGMNAMMDHIFSSPPLLDDSFYGFVTHEMREMQIVGMGQYAHGNQPIQHMIYLYDWTGQPWKTQYWVRKAMRRLYRPTPDGYCGDEDNGQTSAWYVMSAMGFYPVCPVTGEYAVGSPLFRNMKVTLSDGKVLNIVAENNSEENVYIDKVFVNGMKTERNFFTHEQLQKGGSIRFLMSGAPSPDRGAGPEDSPFSFSVVR